MNALSLPQRPASAHDALVAAFADTFPEYLLGQERHLCQLGLDTCTTPAQRRGWLDAQHYSSLPDGVDPEFWEEERRSLYAAHGVCMNGAWR